MNLLGVEMKRVGGLFVLILLAPPTLFFGVVAAFFLGRQFISGWIPSNWFSDSPLDWAFGIGSNGSASNYLGFMLASVPACICYSGAKWGYDKWKSCDQDRDSV
jgi:hypothetical protein